MANTFQEIITSVYSKLSEFDDSLEYDQLSIVEPRINSVIKNICKGEYTSYLNPTNTFQGGDISFLRKTFQLKKTGGYTSEIKYKEGDILLEIRDDFIWGGGKVPDHLEDGAILIGGDIVPYSGAAITLVNYIGNVLNNESSITLLEDAVAVKSIDIDGVTIDDSEWTFDGKDTVYFNSPVTSINVEIEFVRKVEVDVSALIRTYEIGTYMEKLYTIPTDYWKQLKLEFLYQNNTKKEISFIDFRYEKPYEYYTFIGDNLTGQYIYIKSNLEGYYNFTYYHLPEDLSDLNDICILPDNYGIDLISTIVAGELLIETEEEVQGQRLLNMGYTKLNLFYKNYSEIDKTARKKIKYTNMDSSYIYGRGIYSL